MDGDLDPVSGLVAACVVLQDRALKGMRLIDVIKQDGLPGPLESILEEAGRTAGASGRSVEYGHPIEDFTRTGKMWAAILGLDEVTPEQVGLCMVAVKISRECNAHKRDNLVDGAGYFNCVQRIKDRQHEGG